MDSPLMKCGHTANAVSNGKPCCAICFGIDEGATEIADTVPDLTGRKAKCFYGCGKIADSSYSLPFFEYKPNSEYDSYYCGCEGWD